jgi:hypothetical protein
MKGKKGVKVMAFKKDNKCSLCSLNYPVHLFDFEKKECVFCANNNPGRPVCYKCRNPFNKDNVAVQMHIDGEVRIVHEKDCYSLKASENKSQRGGENFGRKKSRTAIGGKSGNH